GSAQARSARSNERIFQGRGVWRGTVGQEASDADGISILSVPPGVGICGTPGTVSPRRRALRPFPTFPPLPAAGGEEASLAQRARLLEGLDLGLAVGEFLQDLLRVLADRGGLAGDPRLGEAEADRVVDGARHLGIGRVGEDAGVPGLLVVDHVDRTAD